jgi:hypothetical protein
VDQAWALEEEFWEASTSGGVSAHYARVLTADAYVVVPGGILEREDLLRQWEGRLPWVDHELSDVRMTLVNGETVVMTYRVRAHDQGGGLYQARISSVYVWAGSGWALALRQHTPEAGTSTDMTLR